MLGGTIAGRALGDTGHRALPTEQGGPRPGGVRGGEMKLEVAEMRVSTARKP